MSKPSGSGTKNATPFARSEGHPRPERARLGGDHVRGLCRLLNRWLTDRPFQLVVCPILTAELRGVLTRPKFRCWITAEEAAGFVDLLAHEAEPWVDPVEVPPTTGDPKDDELVAFHRNCQADLLISGDADLLELAADDVTVLTPRELLERLRT
jgi:predicted nucleic acid-binding protein